MVRQVLVEWQGRCHCIDLPEPEQLQQNGDTFDDCCSPTDLLHSHLEAALAARLCGSGGPLQFASFSAVSASAPFPSSAAPPSSVSTPPSLLFLASGKPLVDRSDWAAWYSDSSSGRAPCAPALLRATVRGALLGGKGGFGANLRASGKSGPSGNTHNFAACRDLYGRRLKQVNDELRLRKWVSDKEKEKRQTLKGEYREPSGPAGLPGWFLGVPSWAEGFKQNASGDLVAQGGEGKERFSRKKTKLCQKWQEARRGGRGPPQGAPRWWGCDRGRFCDYAHGEEELRSTAKVAVAELRRETARRDAEAALEAYTKGMYVYPSSGEGEGGSGGGGAMMQSVLQGLRAQEEGASSSSSSSSSSGAGRKRRRAEGEGEPAPPAGIMAQAAPLALPDPTALCFSDAAWLAVVGGSPRDVEVEYRHHGTTSVLGSGSAAAPHPSSEDGSPSGGGEPADVRGAVAEVEGLTEFATVAVCGVVVPLAGAAGASSSAAHSSSSQHPPPHPHPSHFYYEVEIMSGGVIQVGWASPAFVADAASGATQAGDGVGDHEGTWAFDGSRRLKWHGESEPYGSRWEAGDVVGCLLSLPPHAPAAAAAAATISFSVNGADLGPAFELGPSDLLLLRGGGAGSAHLFPCVSLDAGEMARLNLGKAGFAYPPALPAGEAVSSVYSIRNPHGPALEPSLHAGGGGEEGADAEALEMQEALLRSSSSVAAGAGGPASRLDGSPAAAPGDDAGCAEASAHSAPSSSGTTGTALAIAAAAHPAVNAGAQGEGHDLHAGAGVVASQPAAAIAVVAPFTGELDLEAVRTVADIVRLGLTLEDLKRELAGRGLKVGGTYAERAERLLAVRGMASPEEVPQRLRGAGFPGPLWGSTSAGGGTGASAAGAETA